MAHHFSSTRLRMDSCDIVIIGAGTAGISAALRAQELGANVVALERGQELGGAAGIRLSGGAFHLAMGPMDLEPEAMLAHVNKVTGGEIAPNLARMVADEVEAQHRMAGESGRPLQAAGWRAREVHHRPARAVATRAGRSTGRRRRTSRCGTCTSGSSNRAALSTTGPEPSPWPSRLTASGGRSALRERRPTTSNSRRTRS